MTYRQMWDLPAVAVASRLVLPVELRANEKALRRYRRAYARRGRP
jgi:hypothetical protein